MSARLLHAKKEIEGLNRPLLQPDHMPESTEIHPDVSVVTPTHRRERQVVEAVQSALTQEGVSVEVIVLDDSADGSARDAIVGMNDPRVTYIKRDQPSGGRPAIVRNEGVHRAHGSFLHFLDDDDRLLPGSLRAMVTALTMHPSAGVAIGRVVPFGSDAEAVKENRDWAEIAARYAALTSGSRWRAAAYLLFKESMLVNSACMIRRDTFQQIGGYDPSVPTYEDVEFFARAIWSSCHVFVDHDVLHRRTGEPSLSRDLDDDSNLILQCYAIMKKKYRDEHGLLNLVAMKLFTKVNGKYAW